MFVEGVLLGHITDVMLQDVEILIERLPVEDNISAGWLELTGEYSHQRALSGTARTHHANKLATRDENEIPSKPISPLPNRCVTSFTSRVRMMLRSSSMIRSEKLHRK